MLSITLILKLNIISNTEVNISLQGKISRIHEPVNSSVQSFHVLPKTQNVVFLRYASAELFSLNQQLHNIDLKLTLLSDVLV